MPPKRGGAPRGRGGARDSNSRAPAPTNSALNPSSSVIPVGHIQSIGVKRPSYGKAGRPTTVIINQFELKSECPRIYHYDALGGISDEKVAPRSLMEELYAQMKQDHMNIFGDAVFDGRKNMYCTRLLFNGDLNQQFEVNLPAGGGKTKQYAVRLKRTEQEIIPEVLNRFVAGQSTQDNDVTVAINALNVVLSMWPSEQPRYATNAKSVFVPEGAKALGQGLTLWRGFFQSVRPTLGRTVVNVDISTGLMYSSGNLIDICLEVLKLGRSQSHFLEEGMPEGKRRQVSKFLGKLKIRTTHNSAHAERPRTLKELTSGSAASTTFTVDGKTQSVQQYYEATYGKKLQHPKLVCVKLVSGAILPLEICNVFEGQLRARAQPPPDLTRSVVEFATRKPAERLASIRSSLNALGYGQSPYLRAFQIQVGSDPTKVSARVLNPPSLVYARSKTVVIPAGAGQWNMAPNQFYSSASVGSGWAILVCARQNFWPEGKVMAVAEALAGACTDCGMDGMKWPGVKPTVQYADPNSNIKAALKQLGGLHMRRAGGKVPALVVAILPGQGAASIYKVIKHFGDVEQGVATQCMMEQKCWDSRRNSVNGGSYFANIALKINAKLGGTNVVADFKSSGSLLGDVSMPTLILGADAIHPPPESQTRPSYTAVVGSLDTHASRYVASCRPQTSKREIIDDMEDMLKEILEDFKSFRRVIEKKEVLPKRIIMFRDGVSEGQFQQVIDFEIPQIRAACHAMKVDAKLTFVVVGKRHHVRFFPENQKEADRTGNCLAGTVVEQGVAHPVEWDYYLQSHAGLLGTSRPAHYNVLVDDNNLTPDALQQLTYTLCHIYARSTRSVSIPAPTYYADIVCSRSANHYDPDGPFQPDSPYETAGSGSRKLADAKTYFRQVHNVTRRRMYFS